MGGTRLKTIRLQDLDFISGKENNTFSESEINVLDPDFLSTQKKMTELFGKVYPKFIDVLCSINPAISESNTMLLYDNDMVQGVELTGENCVDVCNNLLSTFPVTISAMTTAIQCRVGAAKMDEISLKLCREFNTVSAFISSSERLLKERIAKTIEANKREKAQKELDGFSKEIVIPLGKTEQGDDFSVALNVSRPDAHMVVSGISGTGKSSLLQSLILGGAYKYPPDKLQFWLLDFKDGNGFIHFKPLKHVRVMCVKNRPSDAKEIMDYIDSEYRSRTEMISKAGGGDICRYNRCAKEQNIPLMPRLVIVIDEFVLMCRACFSTLNNIARTGRSVGISLILSSQTIETGAAYSDAVQQTTHLFEFKNFDGVFGKLIKNVTDKERMYVEQGPGACVYRYGMEKIPFRSAFAGSVEEQNEFIARINEKWRDHDFGEPIISGQPERKLIGANKLSVDGAAVRDTYEKNKCVLVPIGETRMGKKYLYKIDRNNQVLIAFGDETRIAGIEFAVIEHFKPLAGNERSVYYIDLNRNRDRKANVVTASRSADEQSVEYATTDSGAKSVINKLHKILQERKRDVPSGSDGDACNPIELIIHNAERIPELKAALSQPKIPALRKPENINGSAALDLDDMLADIKPSVPLGSAPKSDVEEADTIKQLREILFDGKNNRIYVMLYFEERSRFQSVANELFDYNSEFQDVLVMPKIPGYNEDLSYSEVVDALNACRLRGQASMFDDASVLKSDSANKLTPEDFICSVLVDNKVPHKIIPYEWTAE